MFKKFTIIISLIILSISIVYCYNDDYKYNTFCFNIKNAKNQVIPYEDCSSQYGKGYYCCGTCENRTCCNDIVQFLIQKDCDITFATSYIILILVLIFFLVCFCVFVCSLFSLFECRYLCFRLFFCKSRRYTANREVNRMQNSGPDQVSIRLSSQNSIQNEILPTYDMVIDRIERN